MTAIQWLYRGWNLKTEIREITREYQEAYDRATNTVPSMDGSIVSSSKDPHKLDRLAELIDQRDEFINRDMKILNEIMEVIQTCPSYNSRCILRLRFIDCKRWQEIATLMSYSDRQIKRIYKKAIDEVMPAVFKKMSL